MAKMKPEERIVDLPEGFDKPFLAVNCYDVQFGDVLIQMEEDGYVPVPGLTNMHRTKLPDPARSAIELNKTVDGFTILFKRKDLCVCQCSPNEPK